MLEKQIKRIRKHIKIRTQVHWTETRPRLVVYRSNSNIYAQIINDDTWRTLCSSSNLKMEKLWTKIEDSKKVWEEIAKIAKSIWIEEVVFDRAWFAYKWRVKSLADWARAAWLKF